MKNLTTLSVLFLGLAFSTINAQAASLTKEEMQAKIKERRASSPKLQEKLAEIEKRREERELKLQEQKAEREARKEALKLQGEEKRKEIQERMAGLTDKMQKFINALCGEGKISIEDIRSSQGDEVKLAELLSKGCEASAQTPEDFQKVMDDLSKIQSQEMEKMKSVLK
jgi:hypothetical protein